MPVRVVPATRRVLAAECSGDPAGDELELPMPDPVLEEVVRVYAGDDEEVEEEVPRTTPCVLVTRRTGVEVLLLVPDVEEVEDPEDPDEVEVREAELSWE